MPQADRTERGGRGARPSANAPDRENCTERWVNGRTSWAWCALDEIDGDVYDSMSHAQIQERLPKEHAARKRDKFT
jgi:hypothetical protein